MQFMHFALPMDLDRKLHDFRMPADDILDGARKYVNSTHGDHVIRAAQHTAGQPRPTASAGAWLAGNDTEVTCSIPDQRHAYAAQVRKNQLAFLAVSDGL